MKPLTAEKGKSCEIFWCVRKWVFYLKTNDKWVKLWFDITCISVSERPKNVNKFIPHNSGRWLLHYGIFTVFKVIRWPISVNFLGNSATSSGGIIHFIHWMTFVYIYIYIYIYKRKIMRKMHIFTFRYFFSNDLKHVLIYGQRKEKIFILFADLCGYAWNKTTKNSLVTHYIHLLQKRKILSGIKVSSNELCVVFQDIW